MPLNSYLPRFSIRQLLIWTAFIGLACVSLQRASDTWVAIAFAIVLVILGATPMVVLLRQGPERAYWMGFAVIDWLYLGLLMYSFALEPNAVNSNPLSAGNLATARIARYCHDAIFTQNPLPNQLVFTVGAPATQQIVQLNNEVLFSLDATTIDLNIRASGGAPLRTGTVTFRASPAISPAGPAQDDFTNVAHALWTLVLAACGGWFAHWLYATSPVSRECRV